MKLSLSLLVGALAASASAQDQSILEIAAAGGFETLVAAVESAGLADTLNGAGPFTVFAPTNEAFTVLPEEIITCLLGIPEAITTILLYHVVPGQVLSSDLTDGMTATTVEGNDLEFTVGGTIMVNDATAIQADILATNGVVHVIDGLLVPADLDPVPIVAACVGGGDFGVPEVPTLPDIPADLNLVEVATAAGFTTLVAAVQAVGLDDTLTGAGPFTVFAPDDDAFSVLDASILECLIGEQGFLTDILLYHVVPGTIMSTDLTDGLTAETVQGSSLSFSLLQSGFFQINASAFITNPDIMASNGVVHVIDAILFPSDLDTGAFAAACVAPSLGLDIIGVISAAAGATPTLSAAISAAGLTDTLSGEGPFTLFAPSEPAFAALPDGLLDCLLLEENSGVLTSILTYHVLPASVLTEDLSDGMTVTTVQGEDITVAIGDGVVRINGALVQSADFVVTNGVIHVIDAVILPPSIDVEAFIATCPVMGGDSDMDSSMTPSVAPVGDSGMDSSMAPSVASVGDSGMDSSMAPSAAPVDDSGTAAMSSYAVTCTALGLLATLAF